MIAKMIMKYKIPVNINLCDSYWDFFVAETAGFEPDYNLCKVLKNQGF